MLEKVRLLLPISRPRFYSYLFGTYLVGVACSITHPLELVNLKTLLFLFYFTFPANLFLYGVNDLYDTETDAENPKKVSHEHLLQQQEQSMLRRAIWLCCILTLLLATQLSFLQMGLLAGFIFLSWAYSAPPLRFKTRPFIDAYSNVLYAFPAFLGYALYSNQLPNPAVVILAVSWTAAMHALSALPDIAVDKAAKIVTTAVYLGKRNTLLFIFTNWLVFFLLSLYALGKFGIIAGIYPALAAYLLWSNKPAIKIYWFFPYINAVVGFVTFWYIYVGRFGIEVLWQKLQSP